MPADHRSQPHPRRPRSAGPQVPTLATAYAEATGLLAESERLRDERDQHKAQGRLDEAARCRAELDRILPRTERKLAECNAIQAAHRQLADLVRTRWLREAGRLGLGRPAPGTWRLASPAGPGDGPAAPGPVVGRADRMDEFARWFRALPTGRLMIRGTPGSGKTSLAILLVAALLQPQPDQVPVLLRPTSWDPSTEGAGEWMARRIDEEYPELRRAASRPDITRSLVESSLVLPVLDGLDEIPRARRPGMIAALDGGPARSWIGTCRTTACPAIPESAAVIDPDPISAHAASDYLARLAPASPGWRTVLAHLAAHPDGPLARTLSSPLYLGLTRETYLPVPSGTWTPDPLELLSYAAGAALRDRLLASMVTGLPNPERARAWLACLANHASEGRDLSWWRLRAGRGRRPLFGLAAGLVAALPVGVVFAVTSLAGVGFPGLRHLPRPSGWLPDWSWFGLCAWVLIGIAYGAAIQVTGGLAAGTASPQRLTPRRQHGARLMLPYWLAGGVALGLIAAGLDWLLSIDKLMGMLAVGTLTGVLVAVAVNTVTAVTHGLTVWLKAPAPSGSIRTPRQELRADEITVLLDIAETGVLPGLVPGVVTALATGPVAGACFGLALGVATGLTSIFVSVPRVASVAYLLAHVRLALAGALPWRLLRFLDDGYRLGILRREGSSYQFRVPELHDHLRQLPSLP